MRAGHGTVWYGNRMVGTLREGDHRALRFAYDPQWLDQGGFPISIHQMFNYLVGNWDGHAKNLALLYEPNQTVPVLAPFYDLVAIEFFNLVRPGDWARDMAFHVGQHRVPEQITRADWETLAHALGMPPKPFLARLEQLARSLPEHACSARRAFAERFGDEPVYDCLEESVRRRCHWTLSSVFTGKSSPVLRPRPNRIGGGQTVVQIIDRNRDRVFAHDRYVAILNEGVEPKIRM